MTSQEIFERLMQYRNESVRGNDELDEYFDAILYSVAKVLDLSDEQAHQLAGETQDQIAPSKEMEPEDYWEMLWPSEQPKPTITLQPAEYEITDGYVGMYGKTYKPATDETLTEAVTLAAERNGKTEEEIKRLLLTGKAVEWQDSPNYYYDHSKGVIRRKRSAPQVKLIDCACGHSVPQVLVMTSSQGTTCPDCYDRMSN